ncbi:MAG: phosphatidate cytidylyltransferase [Alphaproteobacteria bacterium]|nr:phosphatidate cytidylyltransferase [Alphaproteobacteria bacterium]
MAAPAANATSNLLVRTISALVLAPIVLGAIYLGGTAFAALLAAAGLAMAYEWDRLCGGSGYSAPAIVHGAVVVAVAAMATEANAVLALAAIGLGTVAAAVVAHRLARSALWQGAGVLYAALPILALVLLRGDPVDGRAVVLWLFGVVWATDIGGYLVGRAIGGPKLTHISPNKTWSGLAGAVAFAAAAGAAIAVALAMGPWVRFAIFAALLGLIAQAGDIGESWIKRRRAVKDSGSLIPGHGGILDRVDGLVTAAPALALMALIHPGSGMAWR